MTRVRYIVWNDTSNLGIPVIDKQHRGLISTINSLYDAIKAGSGSAKVGQTLTLLKDYTESHFSTEEALLLEAKYPEMEKHIELHRNLTDTTKSMYNDVLINKEPDRVLQFLKQWWLDHINVQDRKYAPFVQI